MEKKETRGRKSLPAKEKKVPVIVMVKRKHSVKAKKQFETIANDLNSQP
jgi:hypothetical protein